MGIGIMICGLNGCGKSTLGKALADKLGYHFIDNEFLYFSRETDCAPYSNPRSRKEVEKLLLEEITAHSDFVFSAVRGDYGEEVLPFYKCVILIEVPAEIQLQRVKDRSYKKFGCRMIPGGDLHEEEQAFFDMVSSRPKNYAESWLESVDCPVIRVDGTKPIKENTAFIIERLKQVL